MKEIIEINVFFSNLCEITFQHRYLFKRFQSLQNVLYDVLLIYINWQGRITSRCQSFMNMRRGDKGTVT